MPAYVIANIDVKNPEAYEEYRAAVPATLEQYGGTYVVRGGALDPKEGDWYPRMVIIQFEDVAAAQRWYDSPEYSAIKGKRIAASEGRLLIVEGV